MKKFGWVMLVSTLLISQLSYAGKNNNPYNGKNKIQDITCGQAGLSGECPHKMPVCMMHYVTDHVTGQTTKTQYCCKTNTYNDTCVSGAF